MIKYDGVDLEQKKNLLLWKLYVVYLLYAGIFDNVFGK